MTGPLNDDELDRLRLKTLPDVARLARSQAFLSAFKASGPRTEMTVISVLPDDTVAYVLRRLDEATGTAVLVQSAHPVLRPPRIVELIYRSDLAVEQAASPQEARPSKAIADRLTTLLRVPCDIAVVDTPAGDTVLHPDTIAKLADLIAGDAELARLIRATIWAPDGDAA